MIWPDNFFKIGSVKYHKSLPPGTSAVLGPFIWTPRIYRHECLLAIVSSLNDKPVTDYYSGRLDHNLLVSFDNNVAMRNVSPMVTVPGGKISFTTHLQGNLISSHNRLEIDTTALPTDTIIQIGIAKAGTRHYLNF